jgi:hypothetical protein
MNSSSRSLGCLQSARHAAMKHDRDRGDERRDRGRSGRGATDSRRSVSPQARRPRIQDRDADHSRHDHASASPQRSGSHARHSRRARDNSSHRSRRRSVSRSGRHRERDTSPRYSDDRRPTPTETYSRHVSHRSEAHRASPIGDSATAAKRPRSRSPPSTSRRKKSRRDQQSSRSKRSRDSPEFEKPEHPRRARDRHRSPHRRARSGERTDREVDSRYDLSTSDRRYPTDRSTGSHQPESDTRSYASRFDSRGSTRSRESSPLSPSRNESHRRRPRSPNPTSRNPLNAVLPDSNRQARSPRGQRRSDKGWSREDSKKDSRSGVPAPNSIDVKMGSRGGSHFRGGYASQQGAYSHKSQHNSDPRGTYSQSPTPNSSYNSPTSQSSSYVGGRPGWNGQQFSPPHS